jgi:hypothetical protein
MECYDIVKLALFIHYIDAPQQGVKLTSEMDHFRKLLDGCECA